MYRAPDHSAACYAALPMLDLVEQASWEDDPDLFISLEEAGLEEAVSEPVFGLSDSERPGGGIGSVIEWFYDGDPEHGN